MKNVTAVIRPEKLEDLKAAFGEMGIRGMTVSKAQGCGNQHGRLDVEEDDGSALSMIPKVKVEVVVKDAQVESVIKRICNVARTGEVGDGKIFVYPVEQCVRIRTGERADKAV